MNREDKNRGSKSWVVSYPKPFTILDGKMSSGSFSEMKRLSEFLKLSEAKTVEWALKRCGLRIKIPSKFYPEG